MAQTLRWPRALKKELETTQTAAKRSPNWPLVYVSIGLWGVFPALIAFFYSNSSIAVFVFLCWVFVTFLVIYGYMIFTSQSDVSKVMKGLEGELAVAYMLDRLSVDLHQLFAGHEKVILSPDKVNEVARGLAGC